ncbi:MAG: DUF4249 domain-containing protein [Cyclobacteriaceae bacterium]
MKIIKTLSRFKIRSLVAFSILSACVERIDFKVPSAQLLTVVEGTISNDPGPYKVKITKGLTLEGSSSLISVQKAKIKLYDNLGNVEAFKETDPGVYETGGVIRGEIGRSYYILIETADGKMFESEPDRLNPVGEIEDIRFEFEARTSVKSFGEIVEDVFNIYVDANASVEANAGENDNYVRWRFTGTYKFETNPELHIIVYPFPYLPLKYPWPCSGYIVGPGPTGSGGILEKIADCTCCTCWVKQFESQPQLSDGQFVNGNKFRNVKVGEVPITRTTFSDKYLIEVEQLSLSKKSFEFFKLVRAQKEGASNLFQPPSGEIKSNIKSVNNNDPIIGIFWATSKKKKSIFIQKEDIPYPIPVRYISTNPCTKVPNSSTTKPDLW